MRYKFHRCQCHSKLPNLTGWYVELRPDDVETLMKLHKGVAGLYYFKFGMDPHIQANDTLRTFYNPVKLSSQWFLGINRFLMAGETVLVNCNGGMMPLLGTTILETVESDDLDWNVEYDDEIITIGKWFGAKHYYLGSSKGRMFVPDKYNEWETAYRAALRHVPAERIKSRC